MIKLGNILKNRPDKKNWSLVDATSFIIMKQWKLTLGLTTDHHFEQAGLNQNPWRLN